MFLFVALPFSRYMHIPTEIYYIFLRNAGIKTKKTWESYAQIQLYSCSRCGVCLDACQLYDAGISDVQSVYFLQFIRNKEDAEKPLFGCLICGRCQVECPVHLNLNDLRTALRIKASKPLTFSYSYTQKPEQQSADTIYFAGCMTHLTPGIKKSMAKIFDYVGEKVWFMDEDKSICCGRPLMLAGQYDSAAQLIEKNTELIKASGAKNLILSCPYCYKVFKEDYMLPDINIKFHANYIKELIDQKKLPESKLNITAIYHDPCELGRGMNIYQEPRDVIEHYSHRIPLQKSKDKDRAICCGAGLGGINLTGDAKNIMTHNAMTYFDKFNPDVLVTACPLCKKTFVRDRRIKV
jgi:Fe-S oxidoreductase